MDTPCALSLPLTVGRCMHACMPTIEERWAPRGAYAMHPKMHAKSMPIYMHNGMHPGVHAH